MDKQLRNWRLKYLEKFDIKSFYYISHYTNFESILASGILPKNEVVRRKFKYESFAYESVQAGRHVKQIATTGGNKANLHDLVPVYLARRTPTLRAIKEKQNEIIFLVIEPSVLVDVIDDSDVQFAFSDGNARSNDTRFFCDLRDLSNLPWEVIRAKYWNDFADGKRKRCSEFLIWPRVPIERIEFVVVKDHEMRNRIEKIASAKNVDIRIVVDTKTPAFYF